MMSEKERKEEIIKDSVSRIIRDSGDLAIQAVDSAGKVMKAGLSNAEELAAKASDMLLNAARRAISAGNVVASDARDATKDMIKETIHAASEIGNELKGMASAAAQSVAGTGKAEEKTKVG